MSSTKVLKPEKADIFQILDAFSSRVEAYEKTASHLRGQQSEDAFFIIEECGNSDEAEEIAKHFRDIIRIIENQI
jgi:hypothetical protein